MSDTTKIRFFFPQPASLNQRGRLKSFIEQIFRKERKKLAGLNYVFCSDKALLKINRDFLQHDYYTDIISFGLSAPGEPVQAEIYISIDRVKENAQTLGVSFRKEIHRVIFHGALHLCGYGDKTAKEEAQMRKKEDQYLSKYL